MNIEDEHEETINVTSGRTRGTQRRSRRKKNRDVIKLRIDGLSFAVTPDIVRRFCSAFGEVSAVKVRDNADGDCWAEVSLREPEQYKRLWAEWLNPSIVDGWRIQVETEGEGPIIVMEN